jgi:hypothetical protein
MKGVYTDYFQKSKVFLYPLLRFRSGLSFVPVQTYICWEHVITADENKFMCEYNVGTTEKFELFCNSYLKKHPLFHEYIQLDENRHLFIFDFTKYKSDFKRFLDGQYSKFTLDSKIIILDFFGNKGNISEYISLFLSPDSAHKLYAEALDVSLKQIEEVFEVCSIPDLEKETLCFKKNELFCEKIKNSSISLKN